MKRAAAPLFDRSSREVLHSAKSWADVLDGLQHVRLRDAESIDVLVLGSTGPIDEALSARGVTGLKQLRTSARLTLFSYTRRFGKRNQHRAAGEFIVARTDIESVYFIVHCGPPRYIRDALDPLLDGVYPRVVRPFLAQTELHDVLKDVQRAVQPDALRIRELTALRRLRSTFRKYESARNWTDLDIESAFQDARERNVWFRSVRFEIARRSPNSEPGRWHGLHGRISKYGEVSVDGGFDLVDQVILRQLKHIAAARLAMFSNRDRASSPRHELKPLAISYDRPMLRAPDDLKRLLEALKRFPRSTTTILHGNPYLHVTVVDDVDFSTADVWVLSQNSVLIIPQIQSSYGALKRLVNHIFENFGEGRIGEAKIA
jgi:hypothetical protein